MTTAAPLIIGFYNTVKTFPAMARLVCAVNSVTLDINTGKIFSIIGYSGARKSILVWPINALEPVTSGAVFLDGRDIIHLPKAELQRIRAGIGMIFQQFNLLGSRTVAGNSPQTGFYNGTRNDGQDQRFQQNRILRPVLIPSR
ncbi:hypothetical protein OQA88_9129 [Cercophora sp. LCS_1]